MKDIPLNISVPGEEPVTTGTKLNELLDRGFKFTAKLIFNGERVRITAFRDFIDAETCSVVIGLPHQSKFADVLVASIRYGK